MASRRVELKHKKAMAKVLSSSGLVCIRSPANSLVSLEEDYKESEDIVSLEEENPRSSEVTMQEQSPKEVIPETPEEDITIFPSPSLRRMLPDKVRDIEAQNRIHVLPKEFKNNIDPALVPKITPQVKYIDIIADLVGCTEYKSSLAEFWFLDTMANLLRRAQEDQLPRRDKSFNANRPSLRHMYSQGIRNAYLFNPYCHCDKSEKATQAVLMLWFCEWMKEIQNFDAADRKRMLRRFKENMLSAARFIAEEPRLPTPDDAGVYYKAQGEDSETKEVLKPDQHAVTFKECAYECAMRDLVQIMHYIFDLFSTDFQFDLVRSIFTFTPEYRLIDMPFTMLNPKQLYAPLKAKKEKPKKEKEVKKDKGPKGKKEVDTAEYLALMELKAKEELELDEQETKDAENWNMRSSILPLGLTATDELFDKYWPPPPPEPVVEEPPPEKGKKDKKKK